MREAMDIEEKDSTAVPSLGSAVAAMNTRRTFSREYKRSILKELDAAKHGETGHIFRCEGLHSQTVEKWRKEESGEVVPQHRGPKEMPSAELRSVIAKKDRSIQRLEGKLAQAEKIIELQK